MGSSPVTATMSSCANPDREAPKLAAAVWRLDLFLGRHLSAPPRCLTVAFSGGADSTALLLTAQEWARTRGASVRALHVDHGLDTDSPARAQRAEEMARRAGVPCSTTRIAVERRRRESLEEAARRLRYEALATLGARNAADAVMTAHHREDQVETLVLRLRQGSGLAGLAGIRPQLGCFLRPFLDLHRADLLAIVREAGLQPIDDPTNTSLDRVRNLVRHRILPHLARETPELADLLAAVGDAARDALPVLERMAARPEASASPATELGRFLLRQRLRRAGRQDPGGGALRELGRQVALGHRAACASGRGAQPIGVSGAMPARAGRPGGASAEAFSYSVTVPGAVDLPALGQRLVISRCDWQPWMLEGRRDRAALCLAPGVAAGTVRNRRAGDRLRPLGAPGERRLKDLLIDRKVPARERDRLPLLCVGGKIAWVPGVTVHDDYRLRPETPIWVATLRPLDTPEATTAEVLS